MMAFGASLSNLSVQLLANHDLFPGISKNGPLSVFAIGPDEVAQRRTMLFIIFVLTLLGVVISAQIAKAIKDQNTWGKDILSLLNFSLGSVFLATYVLTIITKG
jgi:hypothetical protein